MVTKVRRLNAEPYYLADRSSRDLESFGKTVILLFYLLEKWGKREGGICVDVGSKREGSYFRAFSLKPTTGKPYSEILRIFRLHAEITPPCSPNNPTPSSASLKRIQTGAFRAGAFASGHE